MALQYNDVVQAQQGMSREDIATQAQKLVPLTPLPKPTPQAPTFTAPETALPSVIDSSVLGTTTKASVPTAAPSSPPPALNVADQILQQTQVEDTAAQKQASGLSQSILDILPKLQGQTQALAEEQQKAGVSTLKADLQSLNSQILQKQSEIGLSDTQLVANMRAEETRDTLLPFAQSSQAKLAGDAAILRALKTSEIGVLNARAIAKQGDIELAIETAQQAVDVKYAPYKEAVSLYQAQLEALQPILSKDEKKQATAQSLKMDLALKDIEQKQVKAKENLALIFSSGLQTKFVNKNGEFVRASDGKSYNDPAEFLRDAGVASFEEAYRKGLVGDLTAGRLADIDFANEARNKYIDVNIKTTDTPEQVAEKVRNSAIWRRETYIAPTSRTGPATLADTPIVDVNTDAAVKRLIASRPGDGGYGATYEAVKAQFGDAVAKKYDRVYQTVFNEGGSVDAGFNNAKLGTSSSGNQAVDQATNIILGSDKFTKDQKASIAQAIQSGQDPLAVIKNQAKNIMGQTNATKLDNYETAKAQMLDIQSALAQYYAAGGKTNVFKGNYEKTINKLGEINDPNLVGIATQIQAALQVYRNAVSGTAYSVQEGKDIGSIFPGINKSEGLNDAIIQGRIKAFDTTIDGSYRNVLGGTYDQLKGGGGTTTMTGPDGNKWEVPNDQVNLFKENGYK